MDRVAPIHGPGWHGSRKAVITNNLSPPGSLSTGAVMGRPTSQQAMLNTTEIAAYAATCTKYLAFAFTASEIHQMLQHRTPVLQNLTTGGPVRIVQPGVKRR